MDIKHIRWFVRGATLEYFTAMSLADSELFEEYLQDTVNIVYYYLKGEFELGDSCSDFQYDIAVEAEKVFIR
jgi:hypothetical protein